jgi:two-component system, response regulator
MNMGRAEILLVEDNPSDVKLALHALKKYPLVSNIHVARDGEEALAYMFCTGPYSERSLQDLPSVIFLDLKIPKISGLEVLKSLKSDSRTKMVPVVVLTSSNQIVDITTSYALGVNSYVVKPVDFGNYSKVVVEICQYWLSINHPLGH